MSKEIVDTDLRSGDLFSVQGLIFDDENLASSGAVTSAEFMLPQAMGGVQLNVVAGAAGLATGAGETVVVEVKTAPESGGTFDNVVFSKTIPASQTYAAKALLADFIPPRDLAEMYAKIVVTSDYDATGQQVSAYLVGVCKS